jgi:hypothetical protein
MEKNTPEKSLKSKELYKTTIILLKVLPMIMVCAYLLMLTCFYYFPSHVIIPHLLGTVFAPLSFIYITSYVFKFCAFHRLFIHYYAFIDVVNVSDHYLHPYINETFITTLHDGGTILFFITAITMYFYKYKREKCIKILNSCGIKTNK